MRPTAQRAHGSPQAPAAGCICRVSSSTAGSGADAAHAAQNNLNSIQGKQGLQLLGLYQVLDLCSGTVEASESGTAARSHHLQSACPGAHDTQRCCPPV